MLHSEENKIVYELCLWPFFIKKKKQQKTNPLTNNFRLQGIQKAL